MVNLQFENITIDEKILLIKNKYEILKPHPTLTKDLPIFIFGAGNFGKDISKLLRGLTFTVIGFVESNPKNKVIAGLPVYSFSELNENHKLYQLVIGVFNRSSPFTVLYDLAKNAGFEKIISPINFYQQFGEYLGWRYWLSKDTVILDNWGLIQEAYLSLEDNESQQTFLRILTFRLGLDLSYSEFSHSENQYFNELTLKNLTDLKINYVDMGAYNGDTFLELINYSNFKIDIAYLFEPDPDNYSVLVKNIKKSKVKSKVLCLPLAVSDVHKILSFISGNGEGGNISEKGNVHIAAVALDDVLPNAKVNFIKIDIEGAEQEAINGARETICREKPIIAMSLYHKPEDLWGLIICMKKIFPFYKIYIRQHFYNSFDSVLYAIPN